MPLLRLIVGNCGTNSIGLRLQFSSLPTIPPFAIPNAMLRSFFIGCAILAPSVGQCADAQAADTVVDVAKALMTDAEAVKFLNHYCADCHQGEDAEGGLDLGDFKAATQVVSDIEAWNRITDRIASGQMPPVDSEMPTTEARLNVVAWIRSTIHHAVCDDGARPGGAMLRRLNRAEYANTVRDLLGIQINAGHDLPADGAGGEGFDNAAETLFVSPIYAEKYLEAAQSALGHALKDPRDRKQILVAEPDDKRSPQEAARIVLSKFLPRAFRRPVDDAEVEQYVQLFDKVYEQDEMFVPAIRFAIEAAMVSPKFLFIWEEPAGPEQTLISQHEMASRLSYFLWASMPDRQLFQLAEEGKLHDKDVIAKQVVRMLESKIDDRGHRRGAKVHEFATRFIEQWLGTRALGREFKPDESVIRRFDSELEGGMKIEPVFFFEDLLAENRSLLNLIDSDFTYANSHLARHYKIKGTFRQHPKRVELPEGSHRGGLLGMSAVLAVSSFPHRTSPVLRGKWIMETLLGSAPPPPPPGVPELEENGHDDKPVSLRERLELHRADPACASCHAIMDPLGFGLENFDVVGRWRTEVDGLPVDARGTLPDGTEFAGPDALKKLLLERKDAFIRNLTAKMLGYALGRGLTNEDHCVVEAIVKKLEQDDYKAQTLIREIVNSVVFRYKQGTSDHEQSTATR